MKLKLESKEQMDRTPIAGSIMVTPPIEPGYWTYRVKLSERQAIVGFPKFGTIGIGFEKERDWNTNLPWTCKADEILAHIRHNKGSRSITDGDCLKAIKLIQAAIRRNKA